MPRISNPMLNQAAKSYVAFELIRRGCSIDCSGNSRKPIHQVDYQGQSTNIIIKASAGRNQPRRWDAGKVSNLCGCDFCVFLNIWDDEKRPVECFVLTKKEVLDNLTPNQNRPILSLEHETPLTSEARFNWDKIISYFNE